LTKNLRSISRLETWCGRRIPITQSGSARLAKNYRIVVTLAALQETARPARTSGQPESFRGQRPMPPTRVPIAMQRAA